MYKKNSVQFTFLFLLSSFALIYTGCKSSPHSNLITKVYVAEGKPGEILFDTESKKGQVLVNDIASVFTVMQTSLSQEWAVVSKMPADPEEARGASEENLLYYVPQKRIVYHPQYGNRAYLIAIETNGSSEEVQWMYNDQTVTIALNDLQKTCLESSTACSDTAGSAQAVENKDSPVTTSQNAGIESIDGWLIRDLPQDTVIAHIGEPDSKGEDKYWGATGTYVQNWNYEQKGLKLEMESDSLNGLKKVRSIIIDSTSQLKTSQGVGIGTDYEAVKNTYAGKIDTESTNESQIVVGSVYGGIIFRFESSKVSQIFIGAGAE
jgi:hypothetical protein